MSMIGVTVRPCRECDRPRRGLTQSGRPEQSTSNANQDAVVDIERLPAGKEGELKSIAQAAAKGEWDNLIDGAAGVVMTLAAGNPLIVVFAQFARLAVAKAFGNATDAMLEALGGVRADFEMFRKEFEEMLDVAGTSVAAQIDTQMVEGGALGVRLRASTTNRVVIRYQQVRGHGSVGTEL
jgi:hypothetical protein